MDTKSKIRMMEFLEWVKGKLYFLRPLLRPFYVWLIAGRQSSMRKEVFLNNAREVLSTFNTAMNEAGLNYTLAFGTLLGAVREKGFIKHDADIDTAMWAEDYGPEIDAALTKKGFKLVHRYTVDGGASAREETYALNGVTVDIFYFYPAIDQYPYCCDFLNHEGKESLKDSMKRYSDTMVARRIQLPLSKECQLTEFEGLMLPVPVNSTEILIFRYGPDYMTPVKNWSMENSYNKYITVWEGKKVEAL
jgi:hypothetical protein